MPLKQALSNHPSKKESSNLLSHLLLLGILACALTILASLYTFYRPFTLDDLRSQAGLLQAKISAFRESFHTEDPGSQLSADLNNTQSLPDTQVPASYDLAVNEERTGDLVFEVPADEKDFSISTMELFDDGTEEGEEGDTFFVFFTAE